MSGIEVADLVLGALPILLAVIDSSKDGMRRFEGLFKRRKHIEKLVRALLLQQQVLKETVRSVVIASGYKYPHQIAHDPIHLLKDKAVQEEIFDYLGPENYAALTGTFTQSSDVVKRVAKNIAGLVGSTKEMSEDLLEIIDANKAIKTRNADILSRAKLVISTKDLKEAIQELDETGNTLDRFVRLVVSNRQPSENAPSRKATKLARALCSIQNFANNLSTAITQGWGTECHLQHEAKLLLEDRMDTAERVLKPARDVDQDPILTFRLVLTATVDRSKSKWHETAVQVFCNDDISRYSDSEQQSKSLKVNIIVPETHSPKQRDVTFTNDICGTIEAVEHEKRRLAFILTEDHGLGAIPATEVTLIAYHQAEVVTLKQLLHSASDRKIRGPTLPLKLRMTLALRLASNLLQLSQTEWLQEAWSKETLCFINRHAPNGVETISQSQQHIDLGRPWVSLLFDEKPRHSATKSNIKPKTALLELGILLLEIWHESTLETYFSLSERPCDHYDRLAWAFKWLDDTCDPLPDLYERAVRHCIQQATGNGMYHQDWDEMRIWGEFCEEVIQPLLKNCKQWR